MPLLLAASDYRAWIDPTTKVERFFALPVLDGLTLRPVSRRVNSVAIDDASVLDPSLEPDVKPKTGATSKAKKPTKPDPQGSLFDRVFGRAA
jgi:hypothetical protein